METWNQLHQPGWRQILANWSLEIETPGANSVTFKPLEEQCNQTVGIRIEVACNGSDGESTQSFELLEMFTLTNLSSSTSYQCKASGSIALALDGPGERTGAFGTRAKALGDRTP